MEKIGIACGCRRLNHGSILQSYALCEVVKEMGYDCEFTWVKGSLSRHSNMRIEKLLGVMKQVLLHPSLIPQIMKGLKSMFSAKNPYALPKESQKLFENFIKTELKIIDYSKHELKIGGGYHKFICGSDQIWNSYEYYLDPMYFLRFTSRPKRVAYAPSFGTDKVAYYNEKTLKKYLSGFDHISVREESGKDICKMLIGRDVPVVLDPTLLLDKSSWIRLQGLKHIQQEDYCLAYFLKEPSTPAVELINGLDMPVKVLPVAHVQIGQLGFAGPREFLELVLNAKYVLTDSFHGTIFSINFEKQFLCFDHSNASENEEATRMTSILGKLGLEERFAPDRAVMKAILQKQIDYAEVKEKLEQQRRQSLAYLSQSLA